MTPPSVGSSVADVFSDTGVSATPIDGDPQRIHEAASNTLALGSTGLRLTVSLLNDGVTSPLSEISGDVDLGRRAASLVLRQWTAGGTGEVTTVEVVVVPDAVYLRAPGLGSSAGSDDGQWWRTAVEAGSDQGPPVLSGLLTVLATAAAADGGVADVFDGGAVRRHRVRLANAPSVGMGPGVQFEGGLVVWVDDEPLVRAIEAVALPTGATGAGRAVVRLEVIRPRQPVTVTVPAAADVRQAPEVSGN